MAYVSSERLQSIDRAVELTKLNTGLSYPENSLLDIAEALGANVVAANLPDFEGKKVKGYIKWYKKDEVEKNRGYRAKIYINSNLSDTTKVFTLGHELGHFLLHKDTNNFRIDLEDYSMDNDPKNEETEANYFAGSLLMPREKLLVALKEKSNLEEVAKLFAVSIPAVESRIKWMKMN